MEASHFGVFMNNRKTIFIDQDTGLCKDDGNFRSYQLVTEGETLSELIESAWICEIDQDGGEHEGHSIYDYRDEVTLRCELIIAQVWNGTYSRKHLRLVKGN